MLLSSIKSSTSALRRAISVRKRISSDVAADGGTGVGAAPLVPGRIDDCHPAQT
jgi:hypothetical protein